VIIDADMANEIGDQFALALALGFPERLRIEAIVAAHYGDAGGWRGIDKSVAEAHRVLELAGVAGKIPVKRGADPIQYSDRMPTSEGVDFIIERAMTATPQDPLWLVLLGPVTDAVAALAQEPRIADRMVVFWHGRPQWPVRCWNFNVHNDPRAVRAIFTMPSRFVLFDTGTYLTITVEEAQQRFAGLGPLGAYLHELRKVRAGQPKRIVSDLGDITALVDPSSVRWERTQAPAVDQDLRYDFSKQFGEIIRIYFVEKPRSLDLFEEGLRKLPGNRE
jgi:inosine-uridine nucleoside N-ribohydrolase